MYSNKLIHKISYLLVLFLPVFLQAQTTDLNLSMTSNNPEVGIYDYITVTTTLQNTGTQTVTNAVVSFNIPTGVAIAGEFPPNVDQGTHEGFYGGSVQGNWFVGEVTAGQSLSFEITFFTLSENNTTFYGQITEGANNDPDSTPGNGTCCTANEDDEAAYTFPNDGLVCTFDEAYAELICDDNGTPNDASDNSYTLRFRADGTLDGIFNLSIPALNYNQTSAYSIGITELTDLSLGVDALELIFTDEAGTENCGETITVLAPPCGGFPPLCEITYNEISNTIDDMGTPNPFDDTFTIVYTIENQGGGTGFVGQFGGQFCGQVPSVGNYGEEFTFTANLANWGNGSTVGCQIIDNENPDCTGAYTLLPDVACGFGNTCADLELRAVNTPTPEIYQAGNTQFVIENEFNGSNPVDGIESDVQVTFSKAGLNIVNVPTVSQGSVDLYWTDNPVWNVGELAPNETAIIEFEFFTVNENYSLFGEVSAQSLTDIDSTPNNGNGTTPQEDDEALYSNTDTPQMTPDFVLSNLNIQNSPISTGQVLNYSYEFTNQGTAPWNSSSSTRSWISTDNVLSSDDLAGGLNFSSPIAAGESYTETNGQSTIDNSLPAGDYFLIVQADELDVVSESDETNNTIAAPFTISSELPCDLTVTNTDLRCAYMNANSDFVYSIEVAGAAGNSVDYEVLGTSFSGTIVTGQLVDIATLAQGTDFTVLVTDPNSTACDYTLTSNIPIAPDVCSPEDCSIDITELLRDCIDPGNPNSDISITATAVSSTGNSMTITINGADVGTIESGISTQIYTTSQGAILDNIVFTDVSNSDCTATTSSFQNQYPNECADVSCGIFEPQVFNISCTETTLTFDVLITGNNLSNNLELRAGGIEIIISPDVLTTVTVPRAGAATEIIVIDLNFSPSPFQNFCLSQFFVDCTPDPMEGADVTLSVSNSQNTPTGIYQGGEAIFTLTNTGTTAATGLTVTFSKDEVNITGTPTTTLGTPQLHWTDNPIWQVGTLAAGQSELIVFPVFTIGEDFNLYGELTAMVENDSDSTPNNGNGSTPVEDDEALWPTSDLPPNGLPDLVITNTTLNVNSTEIGGTIDYSFTIENQGDAPNMGGFVFSGIVTNGDILSSYFVQGTDLVTDILAPGTSIVRSGTFSLNADIPNGYNYFGIQIDAGGNIVESDEDNNLYLDGYYFFDEANHPCMVNLELLNINCSVDEGLYDLTVSMDAINLFPINQTYTVLNGEFLGVAFTGDSDVRTFYDIPLDQVTEISTDDSVNSSCIAGTLTVEVDPATDCDVVSQGVDLELTATASSETASIYSVYSVTYTLINAGNADATGIIIKSPRHPDVVFAGGDEFTVSQGDFDFYETDAYWNVGNLAAGETATITMNFFTLDTGSITNYAFVIAQNEADFDSTPNEWNCCVAVEDDEAGLIVNVTQNFTDDNPDDVLSVSAYPVPVQDYLTVEIASKTSDVVNLEVLDVTGRAQIFQEMEAAKGAQTLRVPVAKLEKGIYLLSVRKGEETVVQRFVKM